MKILFLIIFLKFIFNQNFFENSKFIKESKTSEFIINEIKKLKNKFSIVLIYSNNCPHCRKFKSDYEKLSEFYNEKINFYAINVKTADEYKKHFDTYFVPVIYFFEYDKKIKYDKGNNFETLSNYFNFFLKKCDLINDSNVLLNYSNFIIGYFNNNTLIENYINITKNYIHLFENCFYSTNFTENNKNLIITNDEKNGLNSFYFFNINYSNLENVNKKFIEFLDNLFIFQEIKTKSLFFILQFQTKDFIIFCYSNEENKNEYLKIIQKLNEISNVKKYFNLFLIDFKAVQNKILDINKNKIYFVNKNLTNIVKFNNISEFKNVFYHSFSYENTIIKILNSQEKNKNKINVTFFLFVLFIYTLIFYLIIIHLNLIEKQPEIIIIKNKNKNDFEESEFLNSIN